MSDNRENSAEDSTMKVEALKAEKRKLKAAITRQLNELAGRVAGVSGGVEPRSLEEMESIKATLERLETIKEKTFEILEELRTLYQQQKDTERQVKVGDEADELNERIEGEASAARRVLTTITRNIHPVSPPSYSSNFYRLEMVIVVGIIWKEFAFQHLAGTKLNFSTGMQRLQVV